MKEKKLYLSNTSIHTFLDCGKKFQFKYINKTNKTYCNSNKHMSFGNSIHATLRDFNMLTDKTFKTLDVLHNLLRKNWVREGYASIEEEKEFGLRGLDMLTNYFHNPQDKGKRNFLIEEMIYKDFSNYTLCGKLDKIYLREDEVIEVIDYKTGNSVVPIENIQLPIYLILAESRLVFFPNEVSLYYLASNKKVTKKLDDGLIRESVEQVHQLCEMISNNNVFDYSPTPYCKTNCEFYNTCEGGQDTNLMILHSLKGIEAGEPTNVYF